MHCRALVLGLFVVGCETGAAVEAPVEEARLEEAAQAEVPRSRPGEPATAAPSAALTLLSPDSRGALEAAPVPMLLLPAEHAPSSIVTSGEHWAALSARSSDLTLSLHATDVAHPVVTDDERVQLPPPEASVRGEPARVTINEQIRSVTWNEGVVSYVLEVECAQPFEDRRCTEPDFALELAQRLVPAGNLVGR